MYILSSACVEEISSDITMLLLIIAANSLFKKNTFVICSNYVVRIESTLNIDIYS